MNSKTQEIEPLTPQYSKTRGFPISREKAEMHDAIHHDKYLDKRVLKFQTENTIKAEEYNAVFLPWGPSSLFLI